MTIISAFYFTISYLYSEFYYFMVILILYFFFARGSLLAQMKLFAAGV